MVVTIKIFKPNSKLKNKNWFNLHNEPLRKEVDEKIFNVDPNPSSKSMGYMVGYIQALEDHGLELVVLSQQ